MNILGQTKNKVKEWKRQYLYLLIRKPIYLSLSSTTWSTPSWFVWLWHLIVNRDLLGSSTSSLDPTPDGVSEGDGS